MIVAIPNLVCKLDIKRNRTSTIIVMYSLYLYFLGLSLRNTSKALIIFEDDYTIIINLESI